MGTLQDLIDIPLDEVSDEELEELIAKGRLAREYRPEPKTRKASAKKAVVVQDTYDDYD